MYPDGEVYEKLYAAYVDGRDPGELIDLAGDVKDKVVWDLCCGTGKLSIECIKRMASSVTAVDVAYPMMKPLSKSFSELPKAKQKRLKSAYTTVQGFLSCRYHSPDFVFCRQAVNYWLNKDMAKLLAENMKPGSVFVFNTFHSKPMRKPKTKEYTHDDRWFIEVSWLVGDTVHHVQVRDGMEPHLTSFRYISPKEYERILGPYFAIGLLRKGNTSLYRCVRRA